ncbi:MAG: hypothetical protein JST79_18185 [Acidobacteria bacterium]|nr:hypothetical protein [Acidobacteriota bacterium]
MTETKLEAQGMFLEQLFAHNKRGFVESAISAEDTENVETVVGSLQ